MPDSLDLIFVAVKTLLIFFAFFSVAPAMNWIERRGAALIQDRPGPNRVGPFGLLQTFADGVKFLVKENAMPTDANRFLYTLAPFLSLLPACLTMAAVPLGDFAEIWGRRVDLQIANLDVGVIYVLAIGSLSIYGILFGGWASNNKYSLFGAMRAASQILSYEVPMGLAVVGVVAVFGSFSPREIAIAQEGTFLGVFPNWGIFYQPIGFLVFLVAAFAETNRMPFDLPESEAELVAGFHTEYGGLKFITFMISEYTSMAIISAMMATMYLGSWHLPYVSDASLLALLGGSRNLLALVQVITVGIKIGFFMVLFVWIRWTVLRFRFDQLMPLAWKNLVPLALVNLVATALLLYFLERP